MEPIRVIIIGSGNRGNRYAELMAKLPEQYRVVGVAEPIRARREHIRELYDLPEERCFSHWDQILAQPKMADLAVIATQDRMHFEPAMAAIALGYHLLLEKPVAPTAEQCDAIARAAADRGVSVLVCHVLRYSPFYGRVKELLMSGVIGDPVSLDQVEGVGNVHHSHSFVRGNWCREEDSAPMLLAKSCHDLDLIQWLLDKPCVKIQSFGSLTHFTEANAPEGAPVSCVDGDCPVRESCPYDCIRHYYDFKTNSRRRIIAGHLAAGLDPTDDEVMEALRTTDYGLCVYHAHNNVVDHQVVNMEFAGGVTASFSMNAFNAGGRYIRIFGTKGELYAAMKDPEITVHTFADGKTVKVPVRKTDETINGGHGGGDQGIIRELYQYLGGSYDGFRAADIDISVRNHFLCFAAEEARRGSLVVDMDEYMARYGWKNR